MPFFIKNKNLLCALGFNMDKGQYTAMIFVDLRKAFDTVNYEILLKNWRSMVSSVLRMYGLHLIYVTECSFTE